MVCEAAGPRPRPERSALATGFLDALAVASIDPFTLRLPESIFEVSPSRFPRLRQQILVGSVEVSIVLHDRAIQA
jgi:hypothetical protein